MNNFATIYFSVGLIIYMVYMSLIYMVGPDNIKTLLDEEKYKNIDINSLMFHVISIFLCVVIWPISLTIIFNNNKN